MLRARGHVVFAAPHGVCKGVSFTGVALLTRHHVFDFARVIEVERNGLRVKRMVNDPDVAIEAAAYSRPTP